jgi:hypothetical protein
MNTKQQFNSLSSRTSDLEKQIKTIQGGNSADWSAITNKPSTFPPSAHTHLISEVSNLQTTLDGKSNTGHTHDYSTLTSIPSTFTPSAHSHVISDVTGLQTALDGKVDETVPTVSGDLNTYTTTGFYHVPANTTNAPTTATYELIVISNGTNVTQYAISSSVTGTTYQRYSSNNGTSWFVWVIVLTTSQLTSTPSNITTNALTPNALYTLGLSDASYTLLNTAAYNDANSYGLGTYFRYVTGGTLTNCPVGVTSPFYVIQYRGDSTNVIQHLWTNETTPRYFMRTKKVGTWGSWTQVNDWGSISNKPSTFPPSTHTHTIADITDLSSVTGTLANLTTTTKSDLVSAINEVNAKPSGGGGGSVYSSFADLNNWIS